jgi:hypothetical protein
MYVRRTPKKPKSKRPTLLSGLGITTTKKDPISTVRKASTPVADGTRDAPIPIDYDDALPPPATLNQTGNNPAHRQSIGRATDPAVLHSGGTAQKRKRSAIMTITGENGKKKKVVDETAFHPDLQKAITEIKGLIANGMFRSLYATLHFIPLRNRVLGTKREIPSRTQTPFS